MGARSWAVFRHLFPGGNKEPAHPRGSVWRTGDCRNAIAWAKFDSCGHHILKTGWKRNPSRGRLGVPPCPAPSHPNAQHSSTATGCWGETLGWHLLQAGEPGRRAFAPAAVCIWTWEQGRTDLQQRVWKITIRIRVISVKGGRRWIFSYPSFSSTSVS